MNTLAKTTNRKLINLIILIGIGFSLPLGLFAQSCITGYVLCQQDSMPVNSAHLVVNGTVRAATQAPDGSFSFSVDKFPVYVTISHISYYHTTIKVNDTHQKLNVFLERKMTTLPQVEISALPQRNLIKDKKIYVIDYAFEGNSILLLSYKNRKQNQAALISINSNGDTLKSCDIQKPDYLYGDCFGINHLINKYTAQQIFVDSDDIKLLYQVKKDSFLNMFSSIVGYSNHKFYIRVNEVENQVVRLFVFDSQDTSLRELVTIVDERGLERLSDKGRLQSAKGYSAADARFEEMCFYNSKVIPIFIKNDSVVIFNTIDDKLETYNNRGKLLGITDFDFHHSGTWDKKFMQDRITGKIYTQFTKRGVTSIAEVDIHTGELDKKTKIPAMNFVQKIAVNDNKIYFLYNDLANNSYKQIYSMNIN